MKSWIKILIGLALGVAFGVVTGGEYKALQVLGTVFIDLLKMLVGILVFSSIVTGICHIHDPKKLGRIGLRTISFYVVSTLIAIGVGVSLAYLLEPGKGLSLFYDAVSAGEVRRVGVLDMIASIVPSNPFAAFVEGNILQVIAFAVLFAFALILTGEKGKPVLQFFEGVSEVMNTLAQIVMKLAPYGVFALIATSVGSMGISVMWQLGKFLLCNYIACLIQVFVFFTIALKILAKADIMPFFKGMKDAIVVAFTTSSSAATLPVSMRCTRNELGVSEDISGFVLSLGSTINMNGAAIGQSIACVFIAQAYGIDLSWFQIVIIFITTLLSAIGAAGVPGTSIIMLSVVLSSVGLPLEGISLVAAVDRLREMVSTVVNILGDAVAALYVARKENELNLEKYNHAAWLT